MLRLKSNLPKSKPKKMRNLRKRIPKKIKKKIRRMILKKIPRKIRRMTMIPRRSEGSESRNEERTQKQLLVSY